MTELILKAAGSELHEAAPMEIADSVSMVPADPKNRSKSGSKYIHPFATEPHVHEAFSNVFGG